MINPISVNLIAGQAVMVDGGDWNFFRVDGMAAPTAVLTAQLVTKAGEKSLPFPLILGDRVQSPIEYGNLFVVADTTGTYTFLFSDKEKVINDAGSTVQKPAIPSYQQDFVNVNYPQGVVPPFVNIGHMDLEGPLASIIAPGASLEMDVRSWATLRFAMGNTSNVGIRIQDDSAAGAYNFGRLLPMYPEDGTAVNTTGVPANTLFCGFINLVGLGHIRIINQGTNAVQCVVGLSPVSFIPRLG